MSDKPPADDLAASVREICLSLPGVEERTSHGSPAFFAGRQFAHLWVEGHHENQFPHLWCAAGPGIAADLIRRDPERFFRPPYVGARGWVGMRLDRSPDWDEVAEVCEDGFRAIAPARRVAELDKLQNPGN